MEDVPHFNEETSDGIDALNLKWVVGFNKDIINGVHNLTSEDRTELFYTSAHTGVIYNYETREQRLMQGHCNKISCCTVSSDKRWIVTADLGDDSLLVIWDSYTATPTKTIVNPHGSGISKLDMSADGQYIVSLSNTVPQDLIVWDWSQDSETTEELIVVAGEVPRTEESEEQQHHSVKFNPSNASEIASNSSKSVLFWQWQEEERTLRYDDNEKEIKSYFRQNIEAFTQTVFIPGTTQAVTGTKMGQIVVCDMSFIMEADSAPEKRRPIKIVQLVNTEVSFLTTQGEYLVAGSRDGSIRFYDHRFTIEAWFEYVKASTVTSISFADLPPRRSSEQGRDRAHVFECPDFIVASNNAKVIALQSTHFEDIPPAEDEKDFVQGRTLVKGLKQPITCVAVHPSQPLVAIAGGGRTDDSNFLYVWNYRTRQRMQFEPPAREAKAPDPARVRGEKILEKYKGQPLCMAYSPRGDTLVVGLSTGALLLLAPDNIHVERQQLKYTENARAITHIVFSADGHAMATCDKDHRVSLFKWEHRRGLPEQRKEWVYCGSHKSHYRRVTGLSFGHSVDERDRSLLKLFSVGEDRRLVEYDTNPSDASQLEIISSTKIEQEHKPTCCLWYPYGSGENLLLTLNDAYKVKLWNANNKDCRLTCLGPASAGPVTKVRLLAKQKPQRTAIDEPDYYLAYKIDEKIIGLMKLPVDGNPNKIMGLIGHPAGITDLAVSGDHKFVFTAGGDDLCVNMWLVDAAALERQVLLTSEPLEPFENMIEGGKFGKAYKDLKDFFYYSQIRSKKENTTKARKLEGSVPLDEVGYLMRAMGYYPSQQEIDNMKNEVKYSRFTETGEIVNALDLDALLKVFVNHRPVYGISKDEIRDAFNALTGGAGSIPKEELFQLLTSTGEPLNDSELKGCMTSLLMPAPDENLDDLLPAQLNADFFIEKVLGFEEVADDEIEGDYELVEVDEGDEDNVEQD